MNRILIVEDEITISRLIAVSLRRAGYDCTVANDGSTAADLIAEHDFDLALLDIMLPGPDGYELLDYLRPLGVPVIFITAKGATKDRVRGLQLGADDYIVKPFEIEELLARVEAVLRRTGRGGQTLTAFDVTMDIVARTVTRQGKAVELTPREFDLLEQLMRNRGAALYRDVLYGRVWGGDLLDSRTLDLRTGVAVTRADGLTQTVFVSHPAQLVVIHIESDRPFSATCRLDSLLQSTVTAQDGTLLLTGQAPEVCMPPYYNKGETVVQGSRGMRFCAGLRADGQVACTGDSLRIENRKEVTLLLSMATSYVDFRSMPTADEKARMLAYFDGAADYPTLLAAHIADFSALMDRVTLELEGGDDSLPTDVRLKRMQKDKSDQSLIALLFQYGRYLTVSGSRPGTNAMTLQGIWNEQVRAPWSSSYTTNINTEMNYWPTDAVGLGECFTPLVDFAEKLAANGSSTAKAYFDADGWCACHNSDIWGATYPAGFPDGDGDSSCYAVWFMSGAWILNQLYTHSLYQKDPAFDEKLKGMFAGALAFFHSSMTAHNGQPVTCPSISPENTFTDNGQRSAVTYMPSMDREILHDFMENCRALGLDAPVIDQVAPAPDGRVPEWAENYQETEVEHRHVSHLYCIYPSHRVQSDALQAAAKQSLLKRGFGGTGWSLGWKVCLWARLGDGENALRLIENQLRPINPKALIRVRGGGSYPNLLDAHPPFQIDGNFGVTAGIAEMLIGGALPKCWSGKVTGLVTPDGTISYAFKNGKRVK